MSKKMNRKLSKVFSDTKRRVSSFTSCKTNKLQNKLGIVRITVIRPKLTSNQPNLAEIRQIRLIVSNSYSYSSQVRQYEYHFNLAKSGCFSSNPATELMPNFDSVLNSDKLLYCFSPKL